MDECSRIANGANTERRPFSDQELAEWLADFAAQTGVAKGETQISGGRHHLHDQKSSESTGRSHISLMPSHEFGFHIILLWSVAAILGLVLAGIVISLFI